jgi:hypothetical protein
MTLWRQRAPSRPSLHCGGFAQRTHLHRGLSMVTSLHPAGRKSEFALWMFPGTASSDRRGWSALPEPSGVSATRALTLVAVHLHLPAMSALLLAAAVAQYVDEGNLGTSPLEVQSRKMKPMFSVHAGEYLTASHIEGKFRHINAFPTPARRRTSGLG